MSKIFKFIFPHKIENISNIIEYEITFNRKENVISFELPFDIKINVNDVQIKQEKNNYFLKFININKCLKFLKNPEINVCDELEIENVKDLEGRMNKVLEEKYQK
ncbi:hypothetical protein SLOPH_677 [Spraguea lophii 42_110]|uniref:Uncharacterized protein n=1 Tax=Spraguea lophii (strain 42_110) TaxID=1358809 RepID=S7XKX3_SPRLO|nr:hypothetical protein SLOPH_677 [Spraguea lophii 42_110]